MTAERSNLNQWQNGTMSSYTSRFDAHFDETLRVCLKRWCVSCGPRRRN